MPPILEQYLPIIQIVADVLILSLLLLYLYRRKEDRRRDKIIEVRAKEMLFLNQTMDSLIKEARKVTEDLMTSMESKRSELGNILDDLEKKEQTLIDLSEKVTPGTVKTGIEEEKGAAEGNTDKYTEAARLAEEGVPPDEIARLVNLSRGEIELILDLKK